jgi:hypothetical protein
MSNFVQLVSHMSSGLCTIVNVLSFCYLVEPQNLSGFIVLEGRTCDWLDG